MSLTENLSFAPAAGSTASNASAATRAKDYLYGPLADFLLLGGGSMIVLIAAWLLIPLTYTPTVAIAMFLVAHVVNHPHFAHSYQMFYDNFRAKAFGDQYSATLRARYIFAGIIAPTALAIYFLSALIVGSAEMIAYGVNLMAFVVGWHYVKQGYGILMLDSTLKKRFLTTNEKRLFMANAYATWLLSWIWLNQSVRAMPEFWGIKAYTLALPETLMHVMSVVAIATFLLCAAVLIRRQMSGRPTAWNGVVAYVVSLYPWMLFFKFSPVWTLMIPAAHSLQYLAVVWRYQLNKSEQEAPATLTTKDAKTNYIFRKLAKFITLGTVLGFAGFWAIPIWLDLVVPYDKTVFGTVLFVAIFWLFINVHHYFLDNVMWRRENTDMKKYLFS